MRCRELIGLLDDDERGTLPLVLRLPFAAHLSACRHCCAFAESYRRTIALARCLRDEPDGPPPPAVPEPLVRSILAARRAASRS